VSLLLPGGFHEPNVAKGRLMWMPPRPKVTDFISLPFNPLYLLCQVMTCSGQGSTIKQTGCIFLYQAGHQLTSGHDSLDMDNAPFER
jgi:hypothetical protein